MDQRRNRTWLASVLFCDIVEFSQLPVGKQDAVKLQFNAVMARAIEHVADADRILIDTGDGLAVCFFGDPEDALLAALSVRDDSDSATTFLVRIGLNLGPVKIVNDINGRTNAIGDGMNVAQRVMSFADPGQLLCSRSFFEVVSRISADYEQLFRFCGVRHDKHVREHSIYEVGHSSAPTPMLEIPAGDVWDDAECAALAGVLARYAGPIAPLLVRRARSSSATCAEAMDQLAAEIDDPALREAFLTEVAAAMKSHGTL